MFELFNLSAIQIFYLIEDKQLDLAAKQLASLIHLERQLLVNDYSDGFVITSDIILNTIYVPLIELLYQNGFEKWHEIQSILTPLDIKTVSLNRSLKYLFVIGARTIQEKIYDKLLARELTFFQNIKTQILFKPNTTINELFAKTQQQLVPDKITKRQLLEYTTAIDEANRQLKEANKNNKSYRLIGKLINYNNHIGHLFLSDRSSYFLTRYIDLTRSDLIIVLLNILMQSQNTLIEQVINQPEFSNPYTGEKAIIEDHKLCFKFHKSQICVNRK